ncbi:MAG: hypothetical protein KF757_12410 [Phycisphaeraceae bacterium]|nr:hypothetical protein [Phycisphaeraceae bacterium]MCW5762493.1 hypothetical protein [Phycisphaeraceae bacterium]
MRYTAGGRCVACVPGEVMETGKPAAGLKSGYIVAIVVLLVVLLIPWGLGAVVAQWTGVSANDGGKLVSANIAAVVGPLAAVYVITTMRRAGPTLLVLGRNSR